MAIPDRPLVVSARNRRVIVVDVDTSLAVILPGHTNQVRSLATLDNGRVVSGSYDGQMLVRDPTARRSRRVGIHDGWCLAVAAPRQPGPLVSGSNDGVVRLWEVDAPEVPLAKKNKMDVRALVVGKGTAYAAVDRMIMSACSGSGPGFVVRQRIVTPGGFVCGGGGIRRGRTSGV